MMGGVVFRDVDAAGHGAEVYNGRGSPGDHGPAVVKYKVEAFTGMEIDKIDIYVEGVRAID